MKDVFLRKHMDSQGFVNLSLISNFKRMKDLTTDLELIKFVCSQSEDLEVRLAADGKDKIRRKEGWEKWVMNMEDRDPSARNDGPQETEQSHSAYSGAFMQPFHHAHNSQQFDMSPHTNTGHFEHHQHASRAFNSTSGTTPKLNGATTKISPEASQKPNADSADVNDQQIQHSEKTNGITAVERRESETQHDDDTRDLLVAVKPVTSPVEVKSAEGAESNGSIAGYA